MDNNAVKNKIIDAIKAARAAGISVISNTFGIECGRDVFEFMGACCAISAVVRGTPKNTHIVPAAEKILDVNNGWIWSFIVGFDEGPGKIKKTRVPEAYAIGEEIRAMIDAGAL